MKGFREIFLLLLLPSISYSQDVVKLTFEDGSSIKVIPKQSHVDFKTTYGTLSLPFKDIHYISLGPRLNSKEQKQLDDAISQLGSPVHEERDKASNILISMGGRIYPNLINLRKSKDLEISRRADLIVKALSDTHDNTHLRLPSPDFFRCGQLQGEGELLVKKLKATSSILGDLEIDLSYVTSIIGFMTPRSMKLDAANTTWVDTGIHVGRATFKIVANGKIDLWPQSPGQYTCGPQGYSTRVGLYNAGCLLGKVGNEVFVIGDEKSLIVEGRLYLKIVESPWNNQSVGEYQVKIYQE